MSAPEEDDVQKSLKARHLPAVKAGGMRIAQHHRQNNSHSTAVDTTGLSLSVSGPEYPVVNGVVIKGHVEHSTEAVQNMHKEKPFINPPIKPSMNIQQPRRD